MTGRVATQSNDQFCHQMVRFLPPNGARQAGGRWRAALLLYRKGGRLFADRGDRQCKGYWFSFVRTPLETVTTFLRRSNQISNYNLLNSYNRPAYEGQKYTISFKSSFHNYSVFQLQVVRFSLSPCEPPALILTASHNTKNKLQQRCPLELYESRDTGCQCVNGIC